MTETLPHDWVKAHAGDRPGATALVSNDAAITYGELDRLADEEARRLARSGLEPGDVVPLPAAATAETVVAMVAVARAGGAIAPYGPHPPDVGRPVDPATYAVVPTSGSGGRPRGVILTRGNVSAAVTASARRLGNGPGDRWLLALPLFHVGGLSVVWRSFSAGGTVVIHPRFDAEAAAGALKSGSVTMASLVPTMLRRILDADPGPYHGLRAVLLGGAPAGETLVERALDAGIPILQTYGMTETCSQVATVEPGTARPALGTAGPPLEGFTVEIVDGEVVVDGPAVSPGYAGEPPRAGPFRTGDLGRFDAAGRLVIEGRRGDVIITGGENVHASAVEAAIGSHPDVRHVVVVGVPDDEWGEAIVAVVEAGDTDVDALRGHAGVRLARHEMPKRWVVVDRVPLLPGGKPDRSAVREIVEHPSR
jgi:O-succinylbenzoic acid--CoA ligase